MVIPFLFIKGSAGVGSSPLPLVGLLCEDSTEAVITGICLEHNRFEENWTWQDRISY